MARAAYFDCFSGISGDMALGALLDAGLPLAALTAELEKLRLPGWSLGAERGQRGFLTGTRALVGAPEQEQHRHLSDVRAILDGSDLGAGVRARSMRAFELLAEAEGRVHGIPPEQVHFHEVGALDAIVDVVGVVAGLELLGVERVFASPLPLGSGWARAAHGAIPVPAPATMALLQLAGAPTTPDDRQGELVTPTGAALLAALAEFRRPAMRLGGVGYGLGARNPPERPNALRVWVGELDEGAPAGLVLLETNIDDQPAEQLAYVCELALAAGALDVWTSPIQMKKGRAAALLSALAPAALEERLVDLLMHETTTLGVRRRPVERHAAERAAEVVATPLGEARVKRKRWRGADLGAAPEYEDCARIARERGLPLREVYRVVEEAARRLT